MVFAKLFIGAESDKKNDDFFFRKKENFRKSVQNKMEFKPNFGEEAKERIVEWFYCSGPGCHVTNFNTKHYAVNAIRSLCMLGALP